MLMLAVNDEQLHSTPPSPRAAKKVEVHFYGSEPERPNTSDVRRRSLEPVHVADAAEVRTGGERRFFHHLTGQHFHSLL